MANRSTVATNKRRLMNKRETPPGRNPAAREGQAERESGPDRVGACPIVSLSGYDVQAQLLPDGARQKAAHRMRLPRTDFHDGGKRRALGPFQQIEDLRRLAAVSCSTGLFAALGRFLRRAGLLPRLALLGRNVGATWRNTGLLGGFRLRARRRGLGGAGFFCNRRSHFLFSFGGNHCGQEIDHSELLEKQGNCSLNRGWRTDGDGGRRGGLTCTQ